MVHNDNHGSVVRTPPVRWVHHQNNTFGSAHKSNHDGVVRFYTLYIWLSALRTSEKSSHSIFVQRWFYVRCEQLRSVLRSHFILWLLIQQLLPSRVCGWTCQHLSLITSKLWKRTKTSILLSILTLTGRVCTLSLNLWDMIQHIWWCKFA